MVRKKPILTPVADLEELDGVCSGRKVIDTMSEHLLKRIHLDRQERDSLYRYQEISH